MKNATRCLRLRCGYTLVEVLVVIAIVGVLLALAIPAVMRTRLAAMRAERTNWYQQRLLGENVPRRMPIKVLFIGNSYTASNDLQGMLLALSQAVDARPGLIVDSHLSAGATLKKHWDDGLALRKIKSDEWDFVVLQEQSQTPLPHFGRDQLFYPYSRLFEKEIRSIGAITLFFMTWSRPDTPGPQSLWTNSYVTIAKQLEAECAPAGIAFEKVKQTLPHITMYQDPGGHPTPEATYLVACVFYATIYDKSPEGLPSQIASNLATVNLAPNDARMMQHLAWQSLKEVKPRIKPDWR